ncbi:glycerol 3-phosphate dehydrogenase (NAD(P)+) [Caminicella sporogenes DSM 14501]|uniref:Glycerol-3-phosphate dehydrogenase [NAD(P)+] n=1 Tax=Caminicella sporogenes DSM 14501 TaxID=1121266 RepID=A0A1M6L381_9FIRM|nr:NAD(P)H-dependent glycerol-3-phosphate dehydrogenase [Caminicella sporogenes]RKD27685.1 glycerol-3-phosphate dehydrogenase [Caminicella sporogenes]SHJ65519.1 glycerol 3-phosphate dehydrogenase (NAD(P)+) [Caminicella sporogenes DSM 14501]
MQRKKIAILGAGSWGTALALTLAEKNHIIHMWTRNEKDINDLIKYKENKRYLAGFKLPDNVYYFTDIIDCIKNCEIIVLAVASQAIRSVLEKIKNSVYINQLFVNVSKGIEKGSLMRISEIVYDYFPENHYVVLSGPSHAEEVSRKIPTTIVAASKNRWAAELVQDIFITPNLRVYTNPDVVGVEIGGSLKNVIALGAGICDGLGFGDNAKAALMTRGIREIARLGVAMGAYSSTFAGLTGIGDLIVTCTSMHSRNRRCGILLGQGHSLEEAVSSIGMVVEGVYTTSAAYKLSQKYNVEMPITAEIYKIIYEGYSARESVYSLMCRSKTHEIEEVIEQNISGW